MKRKTTFVERAALLASPYERARRYLAETIWQYDVAKLKYRWQRWGVLGLRCLYLTSRGLVSSRVQLQASSLTYTTMLALVPFFAVIFAIFQGFGGLNGADQLVKQFLIEQIAANPEQVTTIQDKMDELVNGAKQHVNTGSGVAPLAAVFLVLTVVSLLSSIESTMNEVWGVKRSRSFIQKFMTYWALATLGPVLLAIALFAGSNLRSKLGDPALAKIYSTWSKAPEKQQPVEVLSPEELIHHFTSPNSVAVRAELVRAGTKGPRWSPAAKMRYIMLDKEPTEVEVEEEQQAERLSGLVLTTIAFTLLYAFMPNTRVRVKPAIVGGFVAASVWQLSKWALASSSSSLVSYNTIYGGLATVPILMFWLYISWLIVILGAELTFAIQNIESQGKEELAAEASQQCREIVALRLMTAIADSFDRNEEPPAVPALTKKLGAPVTLASAIIFHLCEDGLLREVERSEEDRGYVPARPLARISIADILTSLRENQGVSFDLEDGVEAELLSRDLSRAREAHEAVSRSVTLDDIVKAMRGPAPILVHQPPAAPVVAAPLPPLSHALPQRVHMKPVPEEAVPLTSALRDRTALARVEAELAARRPPEPTGPVGAGGSLELAALLDGSDLGGSAPSEAESGGEAAAGAGR